MLRDRLRQGVPDCGGICQHVRQGEGGRDAGRVRVAIDANRAQLRRPVLLDQLTSAKTGEPGETSSIGRGKYPAHLTDYHSKAGENAIMILMSTSNSHVNCTKLPFRTVECDNW